jgi:sugar/nucleoside kinase (ribokinase family)
VAVGDVMVDVVCAETPSAGARVHADVSVRAGGSAVNAARAAADAGASAVVIGRIGSDPAGDLVLAELSRRGISAELARDPEVPTGAAAAFPGPTVVAMRGANERFAPTDVPEAIDADALFVSGFALFQAGSADAAAAAMERFSGAWVGISVASPPLAGVARDVEIVGGETRTAIVATADEAHALTGLSPNEAAQALAAKFSVACVTLGEEGAIASEGSRLEKRRPEQRHRESRLGAGDEFAGAFLVALTAGMPLGTALELACAAGARAAHSRNR